MAYTLNYSLINNDTEYEVTGYTGEPVDVVIPSSYNGKPVMSIGATAFSGCKSLTSVVIPESVTSIGSGAFLNCRSLTSVVIGDSVTSIYYRVFYNCSSLTNITLLAKTPATVSSEAFLNISTEAKFYCLSSAIDSYKTAANWSTYADKFVADDMRLYFVMNARAQKRYFLAKNELGDLHFENNYIHWTGDPYDGIKIGMDEMYLTMKADYFRLDDNNNLGDWVLSYDGPNEEFHINPVCCFNNGIYVDGNAFIQGELTIDNGSLYSTSSEIYIYPASQDNYLRISDDDELIELRANSDGATISLITEGSTEDTRIELNSVSPSADSKIRLYPEGGSFLGYDGVTILSTHDSAGNINSQSDGARLSMDCFGRIVFTAFGSESTTFTWNGNPILTKANFKLTGTNNDILEITV